MKTIILVVSLILMFGNFVVAQETPKNDSDSLAVSIRATFMLHIVNYSRWSNPFKKQNFCFLEQAEARYYRELRKDDFAKNAKVELNIVQINNVPEAFVRKCHYLFLDQTNENEDNLLQLETASQQMVTIGESTQFVDHGGLMSLVSEVDRVKIYINRKRYETSPVKFSARLLKFANFSG